MRLGRNSEARKRRGTNQAKKSGSRRVEEGRKKYPRLQEEKEAERSRSQSKGELIETRKLMGAERVLLTEKKKWESVLALFNSLGKFRKNLTLESAAKVK